MSRYPWYFPRCLCLAALLGASAALPAAAQGGPTVTITPGSTTYTTATTVNVQIDYCSARPFNMSTHVITENGNDVTSSFTITGTIPPGCVYGMRATGTVDLSSRNGNPVQKTLAAMVEDTYSYMGGGQATYTYTPPGFVREQHAVWVTPVPAAQHAMPGTWNSTSFTIYNSGTRAGTYNLSALCAGGVSSCSVSPSSVSLDTLTARSSTVSVTYWAGATQGDTGTIRLTATHGTQPAAWDSASTHVRVSTISAARPAGVSLVSDGHVRKRGLCFVAPAGTDGAYECGDLRLAHGLPAVRTRNQVRQLSLLYNSAQARPYPTVSADVTLPSHLGTPQQVQARLWYNGVAVASGQWTSGWAPGETRRITLGFDATNYATEIYGMQLEVAYLWGNNSWTSDWVNAAVPIVNRTASAFGAGWWIAGLEQLITRWNGDFTRVGGDGSTTYYSRVGSTNVWQAYAIAGPDSLYQDGSGNLRHRTSSGAEVVFDAQGRHIRTEPLNGPATYYTYDTSGRLAGVQLPSGSTTVSYSLVYGSSTVTVTLNSGSSTRSTTINLVSGRVQHITDPDGTYVQFGYGSGIDDMRVAYRIDRLNAVTYYGYDALKKLSSHSLTLADNTVIASSFTPAESRGATGATVHHPDSAFTLIDGPRTDVTDQTRIWVNGHGSASRIRDAEGWETEILHDSYFTALPRETRSPTGAVSKAWYNWRGLVDSSAVVNRRSGSDPAAVTRVTWHPSLALPTMTQAPTGEAVYRGYNTDGTLAWVQPGPSSNRRSNFYYHSSGAAAGQYAYSTIPGTSATDLASYDAGLGNVSASMNRLQHTTTFGQDGFGRIVATSGDYATGKTRYDSTFYDAMGRDTLSVSRAMPNTYAGTFVSTGNVTMPDLALKVRQVYDAEGRLLDITRWSVPDSAEMNVMQNTYTYDRAGRKTAEHRTGGGGTGNMPLAAGSQFFTYNPAGNLIQHQDGAVIRTMAYDALGRMTRRTIPDQTYAVSHCSNLDPLGSNGACHYSFPLSTGGTAALKVDGDTELFAYDRAGNVTRADNQHARISRRYSPGGLLLTDTLRIRKVRYATTGSAVPAQDFTNAYGIGYTYDAGGRRASLSFPDQLDPCWGPCAAQQYTYDSNTGALSQIPDLRGQYFGFSYTNAGQLQQLTYPGSVAEQILSYDAEGSPLVRHVTRSGVPWIADTMVYDPVGRPLSVRGRNLTSGVPQTTYNTYDGLGSLAMTEFYNGGTPRLEVLGGRPRHELQDGATQHQARPVGAEPDREVPAVHGRWAHRAGQHVHGFAARLARQHRLLLRRPGADALQLLPDVRLPDQHERLPPERELLRRQRAAGAVRAARGRHAAGLARTGPARGGGDVPV